MTTHPSVARCNQALSDIGIDVNIVEHQKPTRSADEAAAAVGCDVAQIIKSLCFTVSSNPVMVLVAGNNRLDEKKLAAFYGVGRGQIKRPDADAVKTMTGYSIGGVNAFGLATDMPILMDEDLMKHGRVWSAAGTPNAVFDIPPSLLAEKLNAVVLSLRQ